MDGFHLGAGFGEVFLILLHCLDAGVGVEGFGAGRRHRVGGFPAHERASGRVLIQQVAEQGCARATVAGDEDWGDDRRGENVGMAACPVQH